MPREKCCPLSLLPLLPAWLPLEGSWKGAERNSSHLQEICLLEKHFFCMTQEQIGRTGLQSGEGKQLESSGGQHILNGIFLLPEAGMGPQSRDLTLFPGPFQQEQHGPVGPGCFISTSATALPHRHGHVPFHLPHQFL